MLFRTMQRRTLRPPVKRTFTETVEPLKYDPNKKRKIARTTLQKTPDGPFPRSKKMQLVYENALTAVNAASAASVARFIGCNSLYDFDKTSDNCFGNKQPLYYDTLLTASGPYKNYKVTGWKTTYHFINEADVATTVFVLPPISATSEIDSVAEADNFPGVIRLYLTAKGGSKSHGQVTVTGNPYDVYPSSQGDVGFTGGYGGDPGFLVYGGFAAATADGTSTVILKVAVKHIFTAELQTIDALVS